MSASDWNRIQHKYVCTIQLALVPKIKHVLKKSTLKAKQEKLKSFRVKIANYLLFFTSEPWLTSLSIPFTQQACLPCLRFNYCFLMSFGLAPPMIRVYFSFLNKLLVCYRMIGKMEGQPSWDVV